MKQGRSEKPRCGRVKLGNPPDALLNREGYYVPSRVLRKSFHIGGVRISAKRVREILGESDYQRAVATARVLHYTNPDEIFAVETPRGTLTITLRNT